MPAKRRPDEMPGCNSDEMKMIHRLFRVMFTDARRLAAEVADADRERAQAVGGFILESAGGLHNHHTTEDLMLWDDLVARRPTCTPHVELMRAQHGRIAEDLAVVERVVPQWQAEPSAAHREQVLAALDTLMSSLLTHLGDEEEQVLPIVGEVLTQSEWDAIGQHAMKEIPRDRMFIQLGTILSTMEPSERQAWFRSSLPMPVRLLYLMIGKRQYEAERARIYGTAV